MSAAKKIEQDETIIRLPEPHEGGQETFFNWTELFPKAQCLIAPCGTKVGKSFGSALWIGKEALITPNLFCVWIAPTLAKCKIGYRYLKAMVDIPGVTEFIDSKLEIRFANGSSIQFLHGKDAEVTIEGEAIDRFVIDETGKIKRQVWYSLITTITQTRGLGIVTGTPRGGGWYKEVFKQARSGTNPFFCWTTLKSVDSPFVTEEQVEINRKLLPAHLFRQYFLAEFVSHGATFGDLSIMWDDDLKFPQGKVRFWVNPDEKAREGDIFHGVDVAKKKDFTVFYSVNAEGKMVGYCRFNKVPYPQQAIRLKTYLTNYFPKAENTIAYDATGIGEAFGDNLSEVEIDATITPVVFTNKSKAYMVTKTMMAIETGFHKAPRIPEIEDEFTSYEMSLTPLGLPKFAAPEGEHDDIVSAAMLGISRAYNSSLADEAEKVLENAINGKLDDDDELMAYAHLAGADELDDFFNKETEDENPEIFTELMEA
jgi:hypothetical protein